MSKTFRAVRPNPDVNLPAGRSVKESTVTKFTKAWKKFTHHRERQALRAATLRELEEAL